MSPCFNCVDVYLAQFVELARNSTHVALHASAQPRLASCPRAVHALRALQRFQCVAM